MSYSVDTTALFEKSFKKLFKKYPSLKSDVGELIGDLEKSGPDIGTPLGDSCYKIRMRISSKGQGKSGGARVIYLVHVIDNQVYLLTIYDKSEQDNVTDKELAKLIAGVPKKKK